MMNENGTGKPKVAIVCPACNQSFSAPIPEGDLFNTLRSSGVVAVHSRLTKCLCGQPFLLGVVNAQMQWAAQPVDEETAAQVEASRIITPGLTLQ